MSQADEAWIGWCTRTAKAVRDALAEAERLHGTPIVRGLDPTYDSMLDMAESLEDAAEALAFFDQLLG